METKDSKADTGANNEDSAPRSGGRPGKRSGGARFGRRKVCPFILDKTLVLDYKNLKAMGRFVTETGKIVPRHVSGVSARHQRQLARHIKRARSLGFVAPLIQD